MVQNIARVKSVLSGDSAVLLSTMPAAPGEPPLEKVLSLAFVTAPRLKRDGDEPHAFASRDYLRTLIVGKEVQFGVIYTAGNVPRDYGIINLHSGESVVELAVKEGWLRVRGREEEAEGAQDLIDKLKALEEQARDAERGQWSRTDDGRIENVDGPPADPQEFIEKNKGKKIPAIVERVIAGDRVAVRLMLEPKLHHQVVVLIAGIRCPRSKGQDQPGEEFGDEARNYVEQYLLQRNVTVELVGLTPQNQLIGTVLHKQGNIAEKLLQQGYAQCQDFHSTLLGARMSKLRAAEKRAKDGRLGVYKNLVVRKLDDTNSYDAIVSRIIWADQLVIRNKAGQEKKISLSSIRAPKNTDPAQAPFQAEAKEFLRKKIIGKHVRVATDGKRPANEGYEEREMATVMFGEKNIALGLVEAGLASVIRHRRDDEDKSPIYDELLHAEEKAQAAKVGMHSGQVPASAKIIDASETMQKAKTYLSFLQRQKRVPAVVDYVASGSRFKVIIPRENARLTFVLSGIRAPRTARNANETSEPFGQEALDFATRRCMQRDVEIDVEAIDKVGGFIGTMYVGRENIAKALVEEGLAKVHAYSAEQGAHASELFAAENKAKSLKKGVWHNYDPEQEEEKESKSEAAGSAPAAPIEKRKDYRDVVVTYVNPETAGLRLQVVTSGPQPLEALMAEFRNFHINPANAKPLANPPRNGEYVAAKFTEDNTFYRARVRSVDREAKTADVIYIDYGNTEVLPWSSLRPLDQPQFSPQTKLKPQAQEAVLSFLQFPTQKYYVEDAVHFLQDITGQDRRLVANVDFVDADGVWYVTLYDPKESSRAEASLNADLVHEGLAMVARKTKGFERAYPEVLASLKKQEAEAKEDRLGMWEYGDITEDD